MVSEDGEGRHFLDAAFARTLPTWRRTALIPIGRFARLTDLSPRLLRRLDERGLLSPVLVDPDTRYRYYDLGQVRAAGLIHLCRQLGLPVDQPPDLLAASGPATSAVTWSAIARLVARSSPTSPGSSAARPRVGARRPAPRLRRRASGRVRPSS